NQRAGSKMHDCVRLNLTDDRQCSLSILQIAFDEVGTPINRAAMSFGEIIEDGELVPLIEQLLRANAPDIAGASDDENFHSRESRETGQLINQKCGAKLFELTPARNWKLRRKAIDPDSFSAIPQSSSGRCE